MTLQRFVSSTILAVASITLNSVAIAQTSSFTTTRVRVGFHPELNTFEIVADSFFGGQIIAPDGTVFSDANYRPDDVVHGLTENNLVTRFAGNWTVFATSPFATGEYQISITAAQLIATVPVPEILNPADGAHLPSIFDIQHTGTGRRISGKFADGRGRFQSTGTGGHVDESDRLPDDFPLSVTGWAFNFNEVVLGAATQISGNPGELIVRVVHSSYSTPRNWTVGVPEPASFGMAGMCLLSLAALRRRK